MSPFSSSSPSPFSAGPFSGSAASLKKKIMNLFGFYPFPTFKTIRYRFRLRLHHAKSYITGQHLNKYGHVCEYKDFQSLRYELPIIPYNMYDKNFVSRSRLGSESGKIIQDLHRPDQKLLDPDPLFQVIPDPDPTQKAKTRTKSQGFGSVLI